MQSPVQGDSAIVRDPVADRRTKGSADDRSGRTIVVMVIVPAGTVDLAPDNGASDTADQRSSDAAIAMVVMVISMPIIAGIIS